jgi:osmotically-inducible protein OsmY
MRTRTSLGLFGGLADMTLHDEALASRIRAALSTDKRVSALPIDVRVSGNDVYVKGMVNTREQIAVIDFILSGVAGVKHVSVDELSVKERAA